ncbi:hypothetical protein WKW79_25510 [Variovorax robiniae]|uniref:Uncharacterized protein n=1 Tax=Variovorax robiniae TaxID=1836199 RepID=A0ABU8XDN5_9BURK
MELSALLSGLGSAWVDDALVWVVAFLAALVGAVAFVNAVDLFLDSDAEAS